MNAVASGSGAPAARLRNVRLHYSGRIALDGIDLDATTGLITGLIGPDGVGKSSLLALVAGARRVQAGTVETLGGDIRSASFRRQLSPRIAYLPPGLGRNLYPTLSVTENIDFFGRLFGCARGPQRQRMEELLWSTGLADFADRPAGQLSGGMKQKLGLCCALVHDPELLLLDEPTTGIDPLSRRQFWELISQIRSGRPGTSIIVATAYLEEARHFDHLILLDAGRVLATGSPGELLTREGTQTIEQAFLHLLSPEPKADQSARRSAAPGADAPVVIEARDLTLRFGDFTAVDGVSFRIRRGEIFGFIGSNGCGKTTTMKLLTGLLPAAAGEAWLLGQRVNPRDLATRRRVGYMTQSFSLYGELTVRQNLVLHGRLFGLSPGTISLRVAAMADRFGLRDILERLPRTLPIGARQRLSLAVAMIHNPEVLILDEPTSGVDPVARGEFWDRMVQLSRQDGVTIFVSTHLMNEAERCDRIALMHAGRVLATDAPAALVARRGARDLEEAFIAHLQDAGAGAGMPSESRRLARPATASVTRRPPAGRRLSLARLLACSRREMLELRRDPVRLTLAGVGSVILMLVLGYGISMDVQDLGFAVLDRDQTSLSRDYALNLAGSRTFVERPALRDDADLERRLRSAGVSLALEIPAGFARDAARGDPATVGAWTDGAMPIRAEVINAYVIGMHQQWLATHDRLRGKSTLPSAVVVVEPRFRYNPDVRSLPAMVPAVIPLLLLLLPAILAALAVVREKELGSIVNLYVTPVSRAEFLLGKQLPYVVLGLANYAILVVQAVAVFSVPLKGSLAALTTGAALHVIAATGMGLVISTFMRTQIGALFGTAVILMVPAVQFSGMHAPVSSLQGIGRAIGEAFPTTHLLVIARGTFAKGLGFADLGSSFLPLALSVPAIALAGVLLLRKQEG